MRKLLQVAIVLVMTVGLVAIGPAAFAAGKPETFTEHERNFTDTFTDVFCIGGQDVQAVISIVENGVFHGTFGPDGTSHVTGTFVGRFVADPVPAGLPTYTGRYTVWFGGSDNAKMDTTTFTFSATGAAPDGSHVNFGTVAHLTAESITFGAEGPIATGIRSEVEKFRCR